MARYSTLLLDFHQYYVIIAIQAQFFYQLLVSGLFALAPKLCA